MTGLEEKKRNLEMAYGSQWDDKMIYLKWLYNSPKVKAVTIELKTDPPTDLLRYTKRKANQS